MKIFNLFASRRLLKAKLLQVDKELEKFSSDDASGEKSREMRQIIQVEDGSLLGMLIELRSRLGPGDKELLGQAIDRIEHLRIRQLYLLNRLSERDAEKTGNKCK